MRTYYSISERGFYKEGHNDRIPEDAVEISEDKYQELLDGLRKGKVISKRASGDLFLEGRPEPSAAQKAISSKRKRDFDIENIIVSVAVVSDTGDSVEKKFNGNERSQRRMLNAIQSMNISGQKDTVWIFSDGSRAIVSIDVLEKAFSKAVSAQSEIWTR